MTAVDWCNSGGYTMLDLTKLPVVSPSPIIGPMKFVCWTNTTGMPWLSVCVFHLLELIFWLLLVDGLLRQYVRVIFGGPLWQNFAFHV